MAPLRDQSEDRTGYAAERPLSATEYVAELGALIAELESAEAGSQALDIRIHYGFRILGGLGEDVASLLIKEGVSWPTVQATLNETVPPYSTSLDAALQGEEIVFAIRSVRHGGWGAMQRTSTGGEELAWAATEPLARRLAALKSWRAGLQKSLEDSETSSEQVPAGRRSDQRPAGSASEKTAIAAEKKSETAAAGNNRAEPNRESTHMEDNPVQAQEDVSERSEKKEKDWEILF